MVQVFANNDCVNLWKKAPKLKLLQPPHRLDGNLIFFAKHVAGIPNSRIEVIVNIVVSVQFGLSCRISLLFLLLGM